MLMMTPAQNKETISFGPFDLVASERLLTKAGSRVELSARAFEILLALLSRPNEVISKTDLIAQVWPGIAVEEGSLRFHVASLRKALGDGKDGARYITTASGRGYCFVKPVSRTNTSLQPIMESSAGFHHANLPGRLGVMIDREEDLEKLTIRLNAHRFVTIVGSGGVGKTTVAIAVAYQLLATFAGAVLYVDLSMLSDPRLVATGVASMLGLSVQSEDITSNLIAYLRDKRLLLVFDTCEHLVEAVAALASMIFGAAPQVHILATSRETLQVQGEHVYRLNPLAYPPDDGELTADIARTFPATQLFVERATASGARLSLNDEEAAIVASICRKLDGVALAIELAARRVEVYGLSQTAALLDQRLTQLWAGPRTAPPRQKTLQATLDWSYGLLTETERTVLRRLAVFVGNFELDAALAVVTNEALDEAGVFAAIDSLVAKSMVAARPLGAAIQYRLLDTTRAYALDIEVDGGETAALSIRHARYYRQWLEQTANVWSTVMSGTERAPYFAGLNNARAALEWCFGPDGNAAIGIGLAAAAVPVFLTLSLLPECLRWSECALRALGDTERGGAEEMHLQACLGVALEHMQGQSDRARTALNRSLGIAQQRGDVPNHAGLLGMLHMFHFRSGEFKMALQYATQCRAVAGTTENAAATTLAHSILGRTLHHMGDHDGARSELESMLRHWPTAGHAQTIYLGYDRHFRAMMHLSRTLWMQGKPDQAVAHAHDTIAQAERMDNPTSLAVVLALAASIFLWYGDLAGAEAHVNSSISISEAHSLGPLLAVGRARQAELAIRRGNPKAGIADLQASLAKLRSARYELLTTEFAISLIQGLAAANAFAEALPLADGTIRQIEDRGDAAYLPELLRVKADMLCSMFQPNVEDAEACLLQSLELSRRQGAHAWELRTAISLARLWADRGRAKKARAFLQPVFARFTEGFDSVDLIAAKALLSTLT
jgi:predicted ATPase/DNA-binding winged helix-turn-helix (wHTH) protein